VAAVFLKRAKVASLLASQVAGALDLPFDIFVSSMVGPFARRHASGLASRRLGAEYRVQILSTGSFVDSLYKVF